MKEMICFHKFHAFFFSYFSQAEAAKSKIHAENQMGWRIDFAIQKNKRDSVNTRLDKGFEKR